VWRADDDDEKKDHRGRQSDENNQRDANGLPLGFRQPSAEPLRNQSPTLRARKRLTADLATTSGTGDERRPLGKPLHKPHHSPARQGENRRRPIARARFTEPMRVGPGGGSMLRRKRMTAPRATDGVPRAGVRLEGRIANRRITNRTAKLQHDGTSGSSRLNRKQAALPQIKRTAVQNGSIRGRNPESAYHPGVAVPWRKPSFNTRLSRHRSARSTNRRRLGRLPVCRQPPPGRRSPDRSRSNARHPDFRPPRLDDPCGAERPRFPDERGPASIRF
jgi:hypothetical protein